jgi:hypothetical protein
VLQEYWQYTAKSNTVFLIADHTCKYKSKKQISRQHDTLNWPFCNHDHTKCASLTLISGPRMCVRDSRNGMQSWSFPSHIQDSAHLCVLEGSGIILFSTVIYFMFAFCHSPRLKTAMLIIYRTDSFSPFSEWNWNLGTI